MPSLVTVTKFVVLVEPENPLNVGFVARAMKCSGITELRIVSSENQVDDLAYRTGTAAKEILESATFFRSLQEALHDSHYSVAFSRRTFSETADATTLQELTKLLTYDSIALVFGRESQGLTRDELACCSILCSIPVEGTMSYNLGQAVAIALYEIQNRTTFHATEPTQERASEQERTALLSLLTNTSSFANKNDRAIQLRKTVSKLNITSNELSLLMGAIKSIHSN